MWREWIFEEDPGKIHPVKIVYKIFLKSRILFIFIIYMILYNYKFKLLIIKNYFGFFIQKVIIIKYFSN